MDVSLKKIIICLLLFFSIQNTRTQNISLDRVEPPNWWVGMETTKLQLLVNGKNISRTIPTIDYKGVHIESTSKLESLNYLFINLEVSKETKKGKFDVIFTTNEGNELVYTYVLKSKKERNNKNQSVNASDVIYLITPDRFSNGDPENDSTKGTYEKVNRSNQDGRHGGD